MEQYTALLITDKAGKPEIVTGTSSEILARVRDSHGLCNYPRYPVGGKRFYFVTADTTFGTRVTVRRKPNGQAMIYGNVAIFADSRDEYGSPDIGTLDEGDIEYLMKNIEFTTDQKYICYVD